MDEKTEALRDIFMDVSEEGTVTERQADQRGSLTGDAAAERIVSVIAEMRDRYEFSTDLSNDELVALVRGYFDGSSDADLADDLGVDRDTVARARLDLHLIRDRDADAPFEFPALRDRLDDGATAVEVADALDVSPSTIRRYTRVLEAREASRRVSERFRSAFVDAIPGAQLSDRLTDDATEDGLDDATEGMETNVSF